MTKGLGLGPVSTELCILAYKESPQHSTEQVDYGLKLFINKTNSNNFTGKNCHHTKIHVTKMMDYI